MKTKLIILIISVFAVLAALVALYMYNKPHKNYETQKAEVTMTSSELLKAFESNEQEANDKYLNKMILVSGRIEDLAQSDHGDLSVALDDPMFGVSCNFNAELSEEQDRLVKALKVGAMVQIKGRCDGYLTDVRLTQCSVVE